MEGGWGRGVFSTFLILYRLFWKFYFKGCDFSVFHGVEKYRVALKPHNVLESMRGIQQA